MFRWVSDDFGGEFLGDVELGIRVMVDMEIEQMFPNYTITQRTVDAFLRRVGYQT